ncbi:MAG: hypothetical protein KKG33_06125, partial [candidate division Zixibacteria bacterium]|nr:hypothetical protein [candidate division Zixibacteria bacterium]
MRHSDSGNKKRFEPEELRRLLRMFWLSAEDGPMSPVIDSTVKAYAYGLPLAIVHEVGPTAPVSETLAVLAVKHTVHVRVPDPEPPFLKVDLFPGPNYSPPLPDESTGIRSVHVPSMSERFSDFEMLVPCILNRVLAELNVFRPTKVTGVEGLFLFVLSYLLKSHKFTMTNVIRDAVIDADGGAVAVPCDFSSSKDSGAFYGWLQELTPGPLLYIGVGKDSDRKGEAYSAIDHWLNRNAASVHLDKEIVNDIVNNGDLVPRRVKRERRFMKMVITFDLKDIGLAARNLAALVSAHVFAGGKARTVLRLRLSGKTEGSIRRSLHFQDKAKYRRFLDDKFIS